MLTTDFVRKTTPVSTLIVAPLERNKSNTIAKFRGEKILTLNDLTAYGLIKEIDQHSKNGKCQYSHIVIPDPTRITSRSKTVRKEVVSTLQILAAEGMQEIHTYNVNLSFKEPLKIGVIACISRLDLRDHRSVWSKIARADCGDAGGRSRPVSSMSLAEKLENIKTSLLATKDNEDMIDASVFSEKCRQLGLDSHKIVQILINEFWLHEVPRMGKRGVR